MLPCHFEQFLIARRVEQMGAGLLVDPEKSATDLSQKLQMWFSIPFHRQRRRLCRQVRGLHAEVVIDNIVRRVEELLHDGVPQ